MNYYTGVLKKYADFSGRARRAEYWMFALVNLGIAIAINIFEAIMGTDGMFGILYSLAVFLPSIAVGARRLHDTGRSGWWMLIALIPIIGVVVLIIFYVQDGQPGDNKYGPNPKDIGEAGGTQTPMTTEQRLKDLESLLVKGLITQDEYDKRRGAIISQA